MIDHLKLNVRDAERSRGFDAAALAPLGYRVMLDVEAVCRAAQPAA
jgi:hypothetical protein